MLVVVLVGYFRARKVILLLAAVILVGGYYVVDSSDFFQKLYWRWTLPGFPPDETAFIAAADELHALRVEPLEQAGRAAALHQAEARLCALPVVAHDWVGRVGQTLLTGSGDGASLVVRIWPTLSVRTAFFPDNSGTLIRTGSAMFAPATGLHPGDIVRFGGTIVGRAGACPGDPPIDRNEELRDPEFLFRFADVAEDHAH
ncbi:MAG TPA: hypothetical protein VIZ17_01980 [Acetobacteraceae bacterium]